MQTIHWLQRSAMVTALLGLAAVACSSAPQDGTGSSEDDLKYCGPNGIWCCRPPKCCPPGMYCPPPPYEVTSFSYWTMTAPASANPVDQCMHNGYAPAASQNEDVDSLGHFPEVAPMSNTIDAVKRVQINLMKGYGCSTPIRYATFRPGSHDPKSPPSCDMSADPMSYDYVFMYMQLCPYGDPATQQLLDAALNGLGSKMTAGECMLPNKQYVADFPAKASTKACTMKLPIAPSGWAWAITSADPSCPAGVGCMVSESSGGPQQW